MTNEKKTEPGAIDEDYDMNADMEADFQRMGTKEFAFWHMPPQGFVDYSDRTTYYSDRTILMDIRGMTDSDFYDRYHETKERAQRRLDANQLMDSPTWNAVMLIRAFKLNPFNCVPEDKLEVLIKEAQAVGELGETFTQGDGIQWLRTKGITPFGAFLAKEENRNFPCNEKPRAELTKLAGEPKPNDDAPEIPGKLPRNGVGRLSVKAAWGIECEEGRRATDREVMGRLQQWADNGDEPGDLKKSNKEKRCVVWITAASTEKDYTIEACQRTLQTWNKSRE